MPLRRPSSKAVPKEMALFWAMETPDGQPVEVYVTVSALYALGGQTTGPVKLLKDNLPLLERVASRKFDRDGIPGGGVLGLTLVDVEDPELA